MNSQPLEIRRSRRAKHVRLKVLPPGRVQVVVPYGFRQSQLPDLLARHQAWLDRTLEKVRGEYSALNAAPPPSVCLPALSAAWELSCRCDTKGWWREGGGRLSIGYPDGDAWRQVLKGWLGQKAREHLVPWLAEVGRETGLTFERAIIRGQKTRWGSCSARGTISLNHSLLFLPPELVRYLFIHELCHTVHMNHSPRFWALVAKMEPGFEALDRELRQAGRYVPAWASAW